MKKTPEMTVEEKIAILVRAILELAEKAATEHDYDGEQTISTGVSLSLALELEAMVSPPTP